MSSSITGTATLPLWIAAADIQHPNLIAVAASLPSWQSASQIKSPTHAFTVASVLPLWTVAGVVSTSGGSGSLHALSAASVLRAFTSGGFFRGKATITSLTGVIRATGNSILSFFGPVDTSVEWTIVSGGGALFPFDDHTDSFGRA